MGLDRINRTNGIRQSQGHGQDYAGRPNIGQRRLKQLHNEFILEELNRSKKTIGIIKNQEGLSTGQRRPTELYKTKICPF
jgi:hypothetical protein